MFDYLEDIIVECPDDLKKATSIFPANDSLFKLNKKSYLVFLMLNKHVSNINTENEIIIERLE